MVPSIGIEPMTFPMSRERATAAPTGLKSVSILIYYSKLRGVSKVLVYFCCFVWFLPV